MIYQIALAAYEVAATLAFLAGVAGGTYYLLRILLGLDT